MTYPIKEGVLLAANFENETVGEKITQLDPAKTSMTADLADHIKTLWADEGTKKY